MTPREAEWFEHSTNVYINDVRLYVFYQENVKYNKNDML